jgi:hypothetical protein
MRLPLKLVAIGLLVTAAGVGVFLLCVPKVLRIPAFIEWSRPYAAVSAWADATLPPGTLVLTERSSAANNEFREYAPKHVKFVSTVPNPTAEQYHHLNFRKQTERFFDNYPSSALYLERHLWSHDEVGPWPGVLERFARHHSMTNWALMQLSRVGFDCKDDLSMRDDQDYFVTSIYYNLPEDLVDRARQDGLALLRLYGEGWRYVKPRQPMQGWPEQLMQMLWLQAGMYADGGKTVTSLAELEKVPQQQANQYLNKGRWADYRIPGAKSPLRLFNLTDSDLEATLTITGIALSGNVRCMIGDQLKLFPGNTNDAAPDSRNAKAR